MTARLGREGRALYDRVAKKYDLDDVQEAILRAACQELDSAAALTAGADPTIADGRRRLAMARQARSAHVAHLNSLHRLKPKLRTVARPSRPVAVKEPSDVRDVLGS
jgi:hypothetical protein